MNLHILVKQFKQVDVLAEVLEKLEDDGGVLHVFVSGLFNSTELLKLLLALLLFLGLFVVRLHVLPMLNLGFSSLFGCLFSRPLLNQALSTLK